MTDEALRASTRAAELVSDQRGGKREGAGRKKGGRNQVRKGWDQWVVDIQAVTRREFRRAKLLTLAQQDPWRYLERIAIPLALRSQPGAPPAGVDQDQLTLPLVYVEMPEGAVVKALGDDSQRDREAAMIGGPALDGESVEVQEC